MTWNLRSVLLLIAIVQGMLAASLLLRRGTRAGRWSDVFLALLLLFLCGDLAPHLIGWAGAYDRWPGLSFFPLSTSFAVGPLIWLAVRALTEGDFRPTRRDLRHFIPLALEKAYYLWAWSHDLRWKNDFVARIHDPIVVPLEELLAAGFTAAYIWAAWRAYRRYRDWVDDAQSDVALQREWLRRLLLLASTTSAVSLLLMLVGLVHPLGYDAWFWHKLLLALVTYWLGLSTLVRVPAAPPSGRPTAEPPAPAASGQLFDSELLALRQQLERCMADDRPWLDPALTLAGLARQVGVAPATLSLVINRGFGRNFSDYVNGHRVRAVQDRLRAGEGERRSLLAIALDCGFAAKSTFNRAFRKETGQAPSQFSGSAGEAASLGPRPN